MTRTKPASLVCALAALALTHATAHAVTLGPDFAADYTAASIGSVPGLPTPYGGLTFLPGDPDTLLIGGAANLPQGLLYTIGVVRDAQSHITGFSGTPNAFRGGTIGEYNDGGVTFGPNGVLFTARWPSNELGQTKIGSTDEDRVDDLGALGIASSPGGVGFVPTGFAGSGRLKMVSWPDGQWYDVVVAPDGSGTFDLVSATLEATIVGGPEGFVYVDAGNPVFTTDSLLVSEYTDGRVAAYEIDANGDPLVGTRRDFLTDLVGAEGAVLDPITGDFLFSTFGGANEVVVVRGFTVAPPGVPEPGTLLLVLAGAAAMVRRRR